VAKEKRKDGARIAFDVSAETVRCTAGLEANAHVNLETALRYGDMIGGHLVTGHIDGVGTVTAFEPVPTTDQPAHPLRGSWTLEIEAPKPIAKFIAAKGSIAVQGVSLTINGVKGSRFHVNVIPHTLDVTTLHDLKVGTRVNLEIDLIARYVQRQADSASAK
jgi:riboflavin synthase